VSHRCYQRLLDAFGAGCIAFVGSGTSVPSGYPTWSGLLDRLRDAADEADPRGPRQLPPLAERDGAADLLWEAEEYRRRLGPNRYQPFLHDEFEPNGKPPGAALMALVALPFKDIITTNYDELIEQAARDAHQPLRAAQWHNADAVREFLGDLSNARRTAERRVLYLHGRYDDPEHVVLTEHDYIARYVTDEGTRRRLFSIFALVPVVFVGFSLGDPDLVELLRQVQAALGPGRARHFAVLGLERASDEPAIRSRLEGKFGVAPVFYPVTVSNGRKDHSALVTLLRQLAIDLHGARAAVPVEQVALPSPGAPLASPAPDQSDPNKGQFGGSAEKSERRLSATLARDAQKPDWFDITLTVATTNPARPLPSQVTFHLHPSFRNPVRTVAVSGGVAQLSLRAYGAFTVGVEVPDALPGRLELDLAQLPGVFPEFAAR
jgi:hypothetical protein